MQTELLDYSGNTYPVINAPLWWHEQGLNYTQSGYGAKIPTRYKIRHNGKLKRIYTTCYGNASSLWVMVGGTKLFLN